MRHNKKRNTALLFEFLVRYVSKCLVDKKNEEASKAVEITKKYFTKGPLREELDLFNKVLCSKVSNVTYASKLLQEALASVKRINTKHSEKIKSNLILEINKTFDADVFYSQKVPNYVIYASFQMLLNNESGKKNLYESVDKITLEDKIVNFMLNGVRKDVPIAEALKLDPKYSNAVYKIVISKFDKKYSNLLSEQQKKLLTKYAVSLISENKKVFNIAIEHEIKIATERLNQIKDASLQEDAELMKKINECKTKVSEINTLNISDGQMIQVLNFISLAEEALK